MISSLRACQPNTLSVIDPTTGEAFELFCEIEAAGGVEYTRARASKPIPTPPTPFQVTVPDRQNVPSPATIATTTTTRAISTLRERSSCQERVVFRLWSARGWFDASRRMMFVR